MNGAAEPLMTGKIMNGTMNRLMIDEPGAMNGVAANAPCGSEHLVENLPTPAIRSESAGSSSLIVHRSSLQRGFSLIELIVVVTIIGILAGAAIAHVRYAQQKAREAVLRDNLYEMRKAIDNFYADKQRYPNDLNELVPNYLRSIPKDPITNTAEWEIIMDNPDPSLDDPLAEPTDAGTGPGVIDVKSQAQGMTLDKVPYNEL